MNENVIALLWKHYYSYIISVRANKQILLVVSRVAIYVNASLRSFGIKHVTHHLFFFWTVFQFRVRQLIVSVVCNANLLHRFWLVRRVGVPTIDGSCTFGCGTVCDIVCAEIQLFSSTEMFGSTEHRFLILPNSCILTAWLSDPLWCPNPSNLSSLDNVNRSVALTVLWGRETVL